MLWVPAVSVLVAQVAVRILPDPASPCAVHPASDVEPSRNLTLPVGALPVTVAVNVTLAPAVDGVSDVASRVVVVALLPPVGSTKRVMLCGGTVTFNVEPLKF